MKVLRFDAETVEGNDDLKWLTIGFNAATDQGTTVEQAMRNMEILDKLFSVTDVDEAAEPWVYMDEARALKPGVHEIAFTQAEFDQLERRFKLGMATGIRTHVQARHMRRIVKLLSDARTVPAEVATKAGLAGAPAPRKARG